MSDFIPANLRQVNILEDLGEWYRIEPPINSYGWVNKKFVAVLNQNDTLLLEQATETEKEQIQQKELPIEKREITVEGVIKPKFFTRLATHKLVTPDSQVFLLNGDKESLDALIKRRVRITGKIITSSYQSYTIIEVQKIESLD
ncbi:MAG: hypothetical protein NC908_00250 [Candidatus Omnitrophica bacterium]|nr:hypothetical protein [Candidatus Omnitrophota bacterium]